MKESTKMQLTNSPCHRWSKRLWTNVSISVADAKGELHFCGDAGFSLIDSGLQSFSPLCNCFQKRRTYNHPTTDNAWHPLEPTKNIDGYSAKYKILVFIPHWPHCAYYFTFKKYILQMWNCSDIRTLLLFQHCGEKHSRRLFYADTHCLQV